MKDRQDGDDAFPHVVRRDVQPLGLDLVDIHVVLDGLGDARAEARFVRSAAPCADAVDVAADLVIGRFSPAEGQLDADLVFVLFSVEGAFVDRLLGVVADDLFEVGLDPVGMLQLDGFLLHLVDIDDLEATVDIERCPPGAA